MIIGSGNELPTPRIVLDILGVESKVDPEPLMFKSIAEGSKQLNYGKVYSGLYEYNGHIVPYIVVVKVGRPSERVRPGNRGKRDTQILMMRYLNRVHFDAPMYPLELEINHQMKNVIGIDPTFYEYVLMVDADTRVELDGLNRLVAVAADDSRIIAICGETTLDNEHGSWWTMIQVYEYYISHHLAKAFESLFGSVTCLPGCFSMYRLRSADKGRPMFISNRIIDEYSENRVDTLHKKNLFALGEDRYLTTLILKHFPTFRTKFTADAKAHTAAPDRFSVLLSQRRRWINSTVHNLAELLLMPELCGFCLFSMRFIVFIDLLGTVILPATVVYLLYLIITVSTGTSAFPLISIIMIAAVYGLQMVIFLFKRQWQYIGWMIIYLLAFPIYSFFLPVYSFWHMDDFSWGNTRIVVGEKGNKKIIAGTDDEPYDDSMIPLKRFSEYQREVWDGGYSGTAGGMPRDGDSFDSLRMQQGAFYAPGLNGSMMFQGAHTGRAASPRGYPGYQSPFESPLREPSRAGSMYKSPSYAGSATGASERASGDYFQSTNLLEKPRYSRSSSFAFNDGPRSRSPLTSFGGPLNSSASQLNMAMPGPMPRAPSQMSMGGGMPLLPHMNSMQGMPSPGFGIQYPSMYGFPPTATGGGGFPASGSGLLPSHSMDMLNRQSSGMALAAQYTGGSAFNSRFSTMTGSGGMANPFSSTQNLGSSTPDSVLPISQSADPSEEELKSAIISFLGAQADLYSVTKRNVRTAVEESFVNADVKGKKALVNRLIDEVLEGKS
jgi:chitin synthase